MVILRLLLVLYGVMLGLGLGLEGHGLGFGLGTHARFEVMCDSTKQAFTHALCVEHNS